MQAPKPSHGYRRITGGAVVALIALGAGWLFLRDQSTVVEQAPNRLNESDSSTGSIAHVSHRVPDRALQAPAVPLTPGEGTVNEPVLVTASQAWPRVPEDNAWNSLYGALDALTKGTMSEEQLLALGLDLIGQVDPQTDPTVVSEGELVKYELLSDPSLGEVSLYVSLKEAEDARGLFSRHDFEVKASLNTTPGAFSGEPQDGATTTALSFTLNVDGTGKPTQVSALCQNRPHHTPQLSERLRVIDRPVAIGGAYIIGPEGAQWSQATIHAGGTVEKPSLNWLSSDPILMPANLADPRVSYMARLLGDLRNGSQ